MLNSTFNDKPTIFILLNILREDEGKILKEYNFYYNKGYYKTQNEKYKKIGKSKDSVVNQYINITLDDIELLKKDNKWTEYKEIHIWYEVVSKLVNTREDKFVA